MQHLKSNRITEYRADIDGIRALAVLAVFIFHLNPGLLPGGFLGVDVFFVISGYLITGIIQREHHLQTFSFVHFYARRVKRIFPALFIVLLLSAFVATFLLPPETYINFMKSARYASAQLANIFFAGEVGYFKEGFSGQPLLHTWSLGVEEQFYLFWPLLIYLCFRIFNKSKAVDVGKASPLSSPTLIVSKASNTFDCDRRSINRKVAGVLLFLSLISFIVCYILAATNYNLAFYMFYTRVLEFCIGGLISLRVLPVPAAKVTNCLVGTLGFFLICYSFLFIQEEYLGKSFLQFGVIVPCVGTALIILANSDKGIINRILATKIPASIGKISYSLYLYHWPVIIFWKIYSGKHEIGIAASLIIFLVAFFLSILSYLQVEQPARKSKFSDKHVLGVAFIVIIVFSTSFKILENYENAPWRITQYDVEQPDISKEMTPECHEKSKNGVSFFECQDSNEPDIPIIALVGDSHSPHYLPSTTAWAKRNGYNVKYIGIAGCPMLLGDVHMQSMFENNLDKECRIALPLFKSQIVDDPKVEFILMAQRFDLFYDGIGYSNTVRKIIFKDSNGREVKDPIGYYRDQLSYTANSIQKAGKKLVILKQVPVFSNIDACNWEPRIKDFFSKERVCEYDTEFIHKWLQPSIDFIDKFSTTHQVDVFDPMPFFDTPLQDGINLYKDKNHLNSYGSKYLVPRFGKIMDEIVTRKQAENRVYQ